MTAIDNASTTTKPTDLTSAIKQDTVALPGNVRLDFLTQGTPDGIPVLLLHGYTDSCRSFKPVFEALPSNIRVVAPSLRGHGDSDRPEHGYRTRDFSEEIAAFMRTMKTGPMTIVGHSMGSAIALRLAIDHPDLVRALVLVGAFASFSKNADLVALYRQFISILEDPVDESFVRQFQASMLARPVDPDFLRSAIQESLKLPAAVWKETGRGLFEDDFSDELDQVDAPTLVLWGDADSLTPLADQHHLVRSIPESHLSIHRGAGHAPHWEDPKAFVAELLAFLALRRPTPRDLQRKVSA